MRKGVHWHSWTRWVPRVRTVTDPNYQALRRAQLQRLARKAARAVGFKNQHEAWEAILRGELAGTLLDTELRLIYADLGGPCVCSGCIGLGCPKRWPTEKRQALREGT